MCVFHPGQPQGSEARVSPMDGALPAKAQAPSFTAPVTPIRGAATHPFERYLWSSFCISLSAHPTFVELESLR
ncbi:hypothetical protein BJX65DRAFT_273022 [Aspergillus insuetus]